MTFHLLNWTLPTFGPRSKIIFRGPGAQADRTPGDAAHQEDRRGDSYSPHSCLRMAWGTPCSLIMRGKVSQPHWHRGEIDARGLEPYPPAASVVSQQSRTGRDRRDVFNRA
jgi:hypothetical protein